MGSLQKLARARPDPKPALSYGQMKWIPVTWHRPPNPRSLTKELSLNHIWTEFTVMISPLVKLSLCLQRKDLTLADASIHPTATRDVLGQIRHQKRQQRANISGTSVNSSKPSLGTRLHSSRLSAGSRNRNLSYGSQGEMSDGGMSDSSYTSLRNYSRQRQSRPRSRPRQNDRSRVSSAYLSSPDIPSKTESKTRKNSKILASTPESEYGRTRSVRNKENIPASNGYDSDLFDRSAEISEIDERLSRLQQLMKTSMS